MKITFKNLAIATSICSALVLTPLSFAGSDNSTHHGGHEKGHQQMSEKKLAKLSRKLGLSESQQADIKALKTEEKTQMQALKPAMKAFREQVKTLMSAESFDEQAFVQLQANNQDVFAAMALVKAKSKFAMKSVLTAEQLEKFHSMKHKRSRR
ncbi:Spy/CpxP family protein refolding chaperone [Colwellia psychrerythraea]|uniref:Heavy-metal resistance protein n=1 Tax=Colwellia psychrerythraea TaxID=28229 RepID=A0A099KA25_COLPS|nr:Spy/CpxP family protein refolding chaperone [Colwellia psychrerythraea]KGJ86473.1 Heavy-metal resistance protein [Colwellia psychrerythraea]